MSSSSLDDILREIEAEQGLPVPARDPVSEGAADLLAHSSPAPSRNSSPFLVPEMIGQVPQLTREMVGGGRAVSEQALVSEGLSARQQRLPKISLHMVGSVLAVFVLMIGLGSSVLLSQQQQDVRQQAFEGEMQVVEDGSTVSMEESEQSDSVQPAATAQAMVEPTPWWQSPYVIAGAAVILSGVLLLAAFFHWLFAV